MIAYPLPAWNWRQPHSPTLDSRSSVSGFLGRLQAHLQRNSPLTASGEADGGGAQPAKFPAATLPAGESTGEAADLCEGVAVKHRGRQVVTAGRTRNRQLELQSWRVNADGAVIQTGASGPQPEPIAQLDLARASKFVVACCSSSQQLKLVGWDVSNTGAIYRAGESAPWPERIRHVRLCVMDENLVVTACITRERRLQLVGWHLGEDTSFSLQSQIAGEDANVREVAVIALPPVGTNSILATLVRIGTEQLVLQIWRMDGDGRFSAGERVVLPAAATQLHLAVDAHGHLITAMRTSAGRLRMVGWEVVTPDAALVPLFDTGEGEEVIRRFALTPCPGGLYTGVTTAHSELKMVLWHLAEDGAYRQGATSPAQPVAAGPLLLCSELLDGNAPLLAGVRIAPGKFKLKTWHS